jgi:DNA repair exonuclease SbcCD ATPase subunit
MSNLRNYSFPVLKKVSIKHFSLYKKIEYLDVDLNKNVFCLAGANGLGKSTFITIINYALTGIVKNPDRQFTWYNSIPSFYSKSKGFAAVYFDGRINDENRDIAEVTLEFTIDDHEYKITRGFFEPDELRFFSKSTKGKSLKVATNLPNEELNDLYKLNFTKDVNLSDFDQFVFLQSFLFTFDETHQLLFWDQALVERVLYLFFGVDASKAKRADQLKKEFNKCDSEVRNLQWQITKTRNQLNSLQKSVNTIDLNNTSNIELFETHKSLLEKSNDTSELLKSIADDIREAELGISDISLKASTLRSEYETIFNQTLNKDTPIEKVPKVIQVLNDLKLRIYSGKDYAALLEKLVSEIKATQKNISQSSTKENFQRLKIIDEQLSECSKKIKSLQVRKDRLIDQEKDLTLELNKINGEIVQIEKDNDELLRNITNLKSDAGVNAVVKTYEDSIEQLSIQKDDAYRKRNKARKELEPLEEELNVGYINAESSFIPMFNQYAKSFLGLDINIDLSFSSRGANLSINIEETKRKQAFQLSESQRYFVDIAIRMALIELCTNSATILIDTPEGSLDIAYESRAGQMFGDFAKKMHRLILTANINSSHLLLNLAKICKKRNMKVERMIDWTILSEVQQAESESIEEAYSEIEKALNK